MTVRKSASKEVFKQYVEDMLAYISYEDGFGISYATPDTIRNDWYSRLSVDLGVKRRLILHARRFCALLPNELRGQKNFLQSLTKRIADYLVDYVVRIPGVKNRDYAINILINDLYDNSISVQQIVKREKQKHLKHKENYEITKQQQAAAAQRKAQDTTAKVVYLNGVKYVHASR